MFSWIQRGMREALDSVLDGRRSRGSRTSPIPGPAPIVIAGTEARDTEKLASWLRESGIWTVPGPGSLEASSAAFGPFAERWVETWREWQLEGVPVEELDRMIDEFRKVLLIQLSERPSASEVWGFESPTAIHLLPFLARALPGFRLIQVLRDGRDSLLAGASEKEREVGESPLPLESTALRELRIWGRSNLAARDYAERQLAEDYLLLRIEDLGGEPESWRRRLIDFIAPEGSGFAPGAAPRFAASSRHEEAEAPARALMAGLELAEGDAIRALGYSLTSAR